MSQRLDSPYAPTAGPYQLHQYGAIPPEMLAEVEDYRMQQQMVGMQNVLPQLNPDDDAMTWLTMLPSEHQQFARELASRHFGVNDEQFNQAAADVNHAGVLRNQEGWNPFQAGLHQFADVADRNWFAGAALAALPGLASAFLGPAAAAGNTVADMGGAGVLAPGAFGSNALAVGGAGLANTGASLLTSGALAGTAGGLLGGTGSGVLAGAGLPTVGEIPLLAGGAGGALAPGAGVLAPGAGGLMGGTGAGVLAPAASAAPFGTNALADYGVTSALPPGGGVLAPGAIGGGGGLLNDVLPVPEWMESITPSASVPGAAQLPPGGGVLRPPGETPPPQGGFSLQDWLTIGGAIAGGLNLGQQERDLTNTSTSGPPAYLQPYLNQALGQAQNIYNANPSAPVIPFSPQTQEALRLTEQRARSGSPLNTAAQNYSTNVLGGAYLNSNPYLDATFERATRGVTNAVQSNFGRSGRDVRGPDAAGVAAMHYGDLANQIYGGNYQAERDRMQQIVPYAGQLADQDYTDYSQLANVGAQYEALSREQADAPGTALDQYLARLQGFPGSSVTESMPIYRNWLTGALGGAAAGYQLGQQNPWAGLAGGFLGGYGG